MSEDKDKPRSESDAEIEREIRRGRKFNVADAIGRLAGPGAMKGVSPITQMQQATHEIENWLTSHVPGSGEMKLVLLRSIKGSEVLLHNFERPLFVLAAFCQQVLDSDYLLKEFVREADVEWGRTLGERPYFEKAGKPDHPDDPYTLESVRRTMAGIIAQLATGDG